MYALLIVACVLASALATWCVREVAVRSGLLDRPNERSSHITPTPRLGGIGLMLGFLGASGLMAYAHRAGGRTLLVLGATAVIACLGLIDDLRPLRARVRLAVHLVAAVAVVASAWTDLPERWAILGGAMPTWFLATVSVLWLTWMTNLYNFMDGIDGLAGGQALFAAGAMAIAAHADGAATVVALLVALAAASTGFLLFNFPPASIFMGDVGSTAIGFFLGAVPFLPGPGFVSVDTVAVALALFILDATATLAWRMRRGERLFEAHRTHFYQRPLVAGVSHRAITLTAYAGMLVVAFGAATMPARDVAERWYVIGGAVALFVALAALVVQVERRCGVGTGRARSDAATWPT